MTKKTSIALLYLCFFFLRPPLSHPGDVTLTIGKGFGAPGSTKVPVTVNLDNQDDNVKGVMFQVHDRGNYLKVTECKGTGRASELNCQHNEKLGYATIGLISMGDVIPVGNGPILEIYYNVSETAPPGESINLKSKNEVVSPATKSIQQGREKFDPVTIHTENGSFFITDASEEEEEEEEKTTTTSPDDPSENDTEEPDKTSNQGIATSQLASDSNRRKSSGGTSQLTYGSPRRTTPATITSPEISDRQAPTRRTSKSTQESSQRRSSGTTTVSDFGSSGPRIIVSPESVTLTSGDLIALAPQTINGGTKVEGNYSYKITPPSSIESTIDDDGLFTAGTNTTSSNIEETIRVTDTHNENATATVTVTITGRKQPSSGCELSISPSSATLSPENSMAFAAHNLGTECGEGLYEWRVNSTIGSSINAQGFYQAGKNRNMDPALDIVMVTDTVNKISSDVIVTVLSGTEAAAGTSGQLNSKLTGIPGRETYPKFLIVLTMITIVIGIIFLRKLKQ